MRTFDVYLQDDRVALPILSFVQAETLAAARDHAALLLTQSPHHRAVSIREGYRPLCIVTRAEGFEGP